MWKFLCLLVLLNVELALSACDGTWLSPDDCSVTCGGGIQFQTYNASASDTACAYQDDETRTVDCNTQSCTKCIGEWQSQGECTATCGGGVIVEMLTFDGDCSSLASDAESRTTSCNTQPCENILTCREITQPFCFQRGLVLLGKADLDLQCVESECEHFCCETYVRPPPLDPTAFDGKLSQSGKNVETTEVFEEAGGKRAVGFFNTSQPILPVTIDGTEVLVGSFGEGVASAKIVVQSADAFEMAGGKLPAGVAKFSAIVSVYRYDKDGNEVHNVPMSWYQGSNETETLTVFIIVQGPPLAVQDVVGDLGGSVVRLTDPLDASTTYWFNCTTPHTTDFGLAEVTCAYYKCKLGARNESNVNMTCQDCNWEELCCVAPECGDGILNWHNGEQCEPPNVGCCSRDCKFKKSGTVCRRSLHPCERQSVCSGFGSTCPKRAIVADGTVCDPGFETADKYFCLHGHCRKSRWCGNGKVERSEDCEPPNTDCCDGQCHFKPSSVVCRAATGACDVADFCSGKHAQCGLDFKKPNGATCYNESIGVGMCLHGVCGEAQDYHSHSSSSSSSSSSH